MKIDYKKMGDRVLKLRKEKDYSQGKLSAILEDEYYINCSRQRISNIEHGNNNKIDLSLLEALSDIFNCDIGYLIGEIEEHTQENKYICDRLNISEKAADNIKACCHGENKDIFNALCEHDNLFDIVIPAIQECVYELVSHSRPQLDYRLLQSTQILDESGLSTLENIANEMAEKQNNKKVSLLTNSIINAGIYKLSVESTQIYKNIIEAISESIINAKKMKYEEYAKSLGINV